MRPVILPLSKAHTSATAARTLSIRSANFPSPQERHQQPFKPSSAPLELGPVVPAGPPASPRYLYVPTVNTRVGRALGNYGAVAMLGEGLGQASMWLNHYGVTKGVEEKLKGEYAQTIQDSFSSGQGVLIVVRIEIFDPLLLYSIPD